MLLVCHGGESASYSSRVCYYPNSEWNIDVQKNTKDFYEDDSLVKSIDWDNSCQ